MFISSNHSYLINLVWDNRKVSLSTPQLKKSLALITGSMKMLIYLVDFFFLWVYRFISDHGRNCEKNVSWENDSSATVLQSSFIIVHCEASLGDNHLWHLCLLKKGTLDSPLTPECQSGEDSKTSGRVFRKIKPSDCTLWQEMTEESSGHEGVKEENKAARQ